MNKITVNNKEFENKEDAIKYIESLNEVLVVKIYAYPDLNEGMYGPRLIHEFEFQAQNRINNFIVREQIEPIIAELRNTLIEIYGAEYGYVMGSKANPIKLWDVEVNFEISNNRKAEKLNMEKLIKMIKEGFKDRLY